MTEAIYWEERAHALLQWNPYSLPHDFDWELAGLGHYSKLQKQRSDKAVEEFDKLHPYEASEELSAFRELERLGVYTQANYFSPKDAKNGFYGQRLREHLRRTSAKGGSKPPGKDEGPRFRTGRRRRRH